MRRRLRATYLTLLVAVLIGLDVPLAFTLASRTAQTMFIDRLNDTGRFASLAEPALRTGRLASLEAELRQYDEVFGIAVTVVGREPAVPRLRVGHAEDLFCVVLRRSTRARSLHARYRRLLPGRHDDDSTRPRGCSPDRLAHPQSYARTSRSFTANSAGFPVCPYSPPRNPPWLLGNTTGSVPSAPARP